MKEFINDCMLFKHKDKQMRIIGVVSWLSIIGMIALFYWVFL